jgi:hypothetical protein
MMSEQCIAPAATWSEVSWACFLSYHHQSTTSNGFAVAVDHHWLVDKVQNLHLFYHVKIALEYLFTSIPHYR